LRKQAEEWIIIAVGITVIMEKYMIDVNMHLSSTYVPRSVLSALYSCRLIFMIFLLNKHFITALIDGKF
jgi:hypothetical protein